MQEHRLRTKDGNWKWVLLRNRIIERSPEGLPLRAIGTLTDIDETKKIQQELTDSKGKFEKLFAETMHPVFITDESGHFTDANGAALQFLECSREELLARQAGNFDPADMHERQQQERISFEPKHLIETAYLVNGRIKTLLLNTIPFETAGKNTIILRRP